MFKPLRHIPLPVLILVLSFLCPTEFSLMVGTFRLSPHRVVLLVLAPISLYRVLSQRDTQLKSFDLVMLAFAGSSVAVFMYHLGSADGAKFGGSLALESFGAYIVARAWIRSGADFQATAKVLLLAVGAAGLIALPETLFGKLFVHDGLRALTGYEHPTTVEQRLGLTRAYGTFDHPIHFGTFAASVLAMMWFSETSAAAKRLKAALIGCITFLGVSSAPILCLGLQGGFILWERITRTMARRVSVLVAAVITLYVIADLVMTRTPLAFVATGLTLDSWTGFYRLQIWEHGMNNVYASPFLGIGLADWTRPWWMIADTVDAFWLVLMMRQGIPSTALLLLAIALLVRHAYVMGIKPRGRALRPLAMGWLISLLAMIMVAFTVHYWNVLFTYFCFLLGLGGVFANPLVGKPLLGRQAIATTDRRQAPYRDEEQWPRAAERQRQCEQDIWAPAEERRTTRSIWAESDIWETSAAPAPTTAAQGVALPNGPDDRPQDPRSN